MHPQALHTSTFWQPTLCGAAHAVWEGVCEDDAEPHAPPPEFK